MNTGRQRSPLTISWIILSVLSLMWGSSFILIKKGLIAFDPGTVGSLRIAFASIFLVIPAVRKINKIKRKHFPMLFVVGLFGSLIPAFLFAKAQTQIDSALAGILNAITPFWVILISMAFFSQKISLRVFTGMFLGFSGTVWLVLSGSDGNIDFNYYALYIILATICYGVNLNVIKYKLSDLDAVTITGISLALVGPIAIAFIFLGTDFMIMMQAHPHAWQSLGALVILSTMGTAIALILFNKLVQITNPVFASSVTYLIPIVAVIWGIIDNERFTTGRIAGMILILIGVYIANRKKS